MKRIVKRILVEILMCAFVILLVGCSKNISIPKSELQEKAYKEIIAHYRNDYYRNLEFQRDEYDNKNKTYIMYYSIDTIPHNSSGWIIWDSSIIKATAKHDSGDEWRLSIVVDKKTQYPNEGIAGTSLYGQNCDLFGEIISVNTEKSTVQLHIKADIETTQGNVLKRDETKEYPYTIEKVKNNFRLSDFEQIIIDLGEEGGTWYTLELSMFHLAFSDITFEARLLGTASGKQPCAFYLDWDITFERVRVQ